MKAREDLRARLTRLAMRHETAYGTGARDADVRVTCNRLYDRLASGYGPLRREAAETVVTALVEPRERGDAAFWSSELGRLLFAAGGFGDDDIGQAFAASVLGCSRQYVGELIGRGKLERRPGGLVSAEQVRLRLQRALDEPVK